LHPNETRLITLNSAVEIYVTKHLRRLVLKSLFPQQRSTVITHGLEHSQVHFVFKSMIRFVRYWSALYLTVYRLENNLTLKTSPAQTPQSKTTLCKELWLKAKFLFNSLLIKLKQLREFLYSIAKFFFNNVFLTYCYTHCKRRFKNCDSKIYDKKSNLSVTTLHTVTWAKTSWLFQLDKNWK